MADERREPVYDFEHKGVTARLQGVIHAVRSPGGSEIRISDSGVTRLLLTRKEAQHLLVRLAEALIDGA